MNLNKFTVILAILLVSILAIGTVSAETVDDSDIAAATGDDIQESVDVTDAADGLSSADAADETVGDDNSGPDDTVSYDLDDDTYSTYFNEDGTATDALSADGNYYLNVGTLTNKDIKIVSGQNVYIQGKEGEGFIKNGTITIGNGAEKINTIQISGITFINNNKDAIVVNQYSEGIAIAGNNFDLTYDDTYPSSPMAIVTYGFVNEIDIVGNNIKMNTAGMYSYGIDLTIYTPNWGPQGDSNPNNIFVADNEIYIDSSSASGMAEGMYLDSLTNSVIEGNSIYIRTVGDAANYGMQLADSCAYNYMSEDEGISPCNVTIKNNTVVLDSNDMAYGITAISASPYDGDFQEYVKNIVISGNDVTVTSAKGAIGIGTSSADAAITDNKVTVNADSSAVNNAYADSYFGSQSYAIYVNNFNEMNGYFHNNTVANNVIVSNVPAVAVNKTEEDDERVLPLTIENNNIAYNIDDDNYATFFNDDGTAKDILSSNGDYSLIIGTLNNKDIVISSGSNINITGGENGGIINGGTITIGAGDGMAGSILVSGLTFKNTNKDAIVINQYSSKVTVDDNRFDLTYDDTYPGSPMAIVSYGFVDGISITKNYVYMVTAGMYSYGIDLTIYTPNWGPQGDSNPNNIYVADNEIYIYSSSARGMAEGMYLDSLTNSVIENNYIYVYTVGDAANYGMQLADSCAYNYMSEDEGISPCNVTIKNNTVVLDSNDMAYGITAISASPYDGDFQEYVKNIVISGNDVTVTSAKGAIGIGTSSADAAITDNKVTVNADSSAVNNAYPDSYFGSQSYAIYVNNFNEMNGYFHNNTVANNVIVSNVPAVAVNKTEEDDERVLPLVIENNEVINSILIDDDSYATYFDENGNIKDDAPITAGDVLLLGDLTNKKLVIDTGLTIRGVPNKKLVNCTIKLIEGADGTIIDGLNMEFTGDESSGGFGVIAAFEVSNIAITNNTVRILDSKGTGYAMAIQIQGLVEGCDNVTVSGNIIDFKGSTAGMYGIDVYTKWNSDAVNTNFVITDNVIDIEGATAMAEPIYLNTVNGVIVSNNILNSQGGEGADAYGIGAPSANNAVIENNIIVAKGTKMTYGISNTKSENVTIRNNDITAEGVGAVGVGLSQDSNVEVSDNKIAIEGGDYNTITTYDSVGTANAGVYVKDDNEDIKVSGNDVSEKSPLRSNTAIEANNISVTAAPSGNGSYEITLRTAGGMILANQVVKVVFNNQMYELTTDTNGVAALPFALNKGGTYNVDVFYLGDDDYRGSDASAKLTINKIATKTTAAGKTYLATAKTKSLTATLKDANGNVLANKKVTFTVNGKTYTATTNAKGVATVKLALTAAKTYTVAIKFAGDNVYAASTVSAKVKLNKEKTKLTAPKKTFKRAKKVKKVVITLKNSKGKAVAKKKITLTVNKKKYTAKTNKKGKATIKVKLTKKGTFKYKVKFAGDTQYKAAKKNGKIKIK